MLYEVITLKHAHENNVYVILNPAPVITSYSIHYTKLYESLIWRKLLMANFLKKRMPMEFYLGVVILVMVVFSYNFV